MSKLSRRQIRAYLSTMSPLEQRHYFNKLAKNLNTMIKSGQAAENLVIGWNQYKRLRHEAAYPDSGGAPGAVGRKVKGTVTAEEEDAFRTSLNIRKLEPLKFDATVWANHADKTITEGGSGKGDVEITPQIITSKFKITDRTMQQSEKLRSKFAKYPPMSEFVRLVPPMLKENLKLTTDVLDSDRAGTFLTGAPGGGKSYIFESYYSLLAAGLALHAKFLWWKGHEQEPFTKDNFLGKGFEIKEQRIYHTMAKNFGASGSAYVGQGDKVSSAFGKLIESNQDTIILVLDELWQMIQAKNEGDPKASGAYSTIRAFMLENYGNQGDRPLTGRAKIIPVMATENIAKFVEQEGNDEGIFNDQIERRLGRESETPTANLSQEQQKLAAFSKLVKEKWTPAAVKAFINNAIPGWMFNAGVSFSDLSKMTPEIASAAKVNSQEAIDLFSEVFFKRKYDGPGGYGLLPEDQRPGLGAQTSKSFQGNVLKAYKARVNDPQFKTLNNDDKLIIQSEKSVEEFKSGLQKATQELKAMGVKFEDIKSLLNLRPTSFDDASIQDFVQNQINPQIDAIISRIAVASGKDGKKIIKAMSPARKTTDAGDPFDDNQQQAPASPQAPAPAPKAGVPGAVEEVDEFKNINNSKRNTDIKNLLQDFVEINLNKRAEQNNADRLKGEKADKIFAIIRKYQKNLPKEYIDNFDEENLSDFSTLKKCDVYIGYVSRTPEETNKAAEQLQAIEDSGGEPSANEGSDIYNH